MFNTQIINPLYKNITTFPDKEAFCIEEKYFTFLDFGLYISKIRKAIVENSIRDKNIGLVANNDIETYASIFALWLEGKSYVPLHPNQPIDRCKDIMSQINSEYILDSSINSRYTNYKVIKTRSLQDTQELYITDCKGLDDDLAYILFTSGSTGKPKGVQISRKNVAAFIESFTDFHWNINSEDKFLQCTDLTFDVSVVSYLFPLLNGSCQYTVPLDGIKYTKIYELLDDHNLNATFMVPSIIRYLKPYFDEINLPNLKYCIFAGEALHVDLVHEWKKCAPNCTMINAYGPTEGTIYVSLYECGEKEYHGVYSIGKAFKNAELVIINNENDIAETGEKGELCLTGLQQTPGYKNNELKNKESFFIYNNKKYYRTGDICYLDKDGDIMYIGRKDSQVKIQGFRIELSEIEFHTMKYLNGINCVAIAFETPEHLTDLAIFIEAEKFDNKDLIEYMRSKMPSYMIPSKWFFIPTFPLNSNGKVDKVKLRSII